MILKLAPVRGPYLTKARGIHSTRDQRALCFSAKFEQIGEEA